MTGSRGVELAGCTICDWIRIPRTSRFRCQLLCKVISLQSGLGSDKWKIHLPTHPVHFSLRFLCEQVQVLMQAGLVGGEELAVFGGTGDICRGG